MALTGKEVGRALTSAAVLLLLGMLVIVLLGGRGDSGPSTAAGDGRSTLELLPTSPSPGTTRTGSRAPTAPRPTASAAVTTTSAPRTSAPAPAPVVTRSPVVLPTGRPTGVPSVVVIPPSAGPTTGTPSPTGRVTLTSALPAPCGRLGQPCRYLDAPAAAALGEGPRDVLLSEPSPGTVRLTASPGAGASPPAVGFVVRVCRCSTATDDVLLEVRLSARPGSSFEFSPGGAGYRVWVQELNEAGLSRGAYQDLPAAQSPTPTPSPTSTPTPGPA